jgi:hypothetical protein
MYVDFAKTEILIFRVNLARSGQGATARRDPETL